jgi:hypothetical protein
MYRLSQFAEVIKAVAADLNLDISGVEFKELKSKLYMGKYTNHWVTPLQPGTYKPQIIDPLIRVSMQDTIKGICDTIAHEMRHLWQEVNHIEYVRKPWRQKEYCAVPGFAREYFMGKKVLVTQYENRVTEIDANAYAKEAVTRLNLCSLVTKD